MVINAWQLKRFCLNSLLYRLIRRFNFTWAKFYFALIFNLTSLEMDWTYILSRLLSLNNLISIIILLLITSVFDNLWNFIDITILYLFLKVIRWEIVHFQILL